MNAFVLKFWIFYFVLFGFFKDNVVYMFITCEYYPNYKTGGDDEDGIDYNGAGWENDVVKDVDYLKILDSFYSYGITFEYDEIYPGNVSRVKSSSNKNDPFCYIIRNYYDLKTRIYNGVKTINLSDCDSGELTLSEIEKWKRKVINEQQNKKTKLRLLNPTIYRSLITSLFFLTLNLDLTINLMMIYLMMELIKFLGRLKVTNTNT